MNEVSCGTEELMVGETLPLTQKYDEKYFSKLYDIDLKEKTKKKNGLTYISWAAAWASMKKMHPDATYTIHEDENGRFWHSDEKSGWIKISMTVCGVTHTEFYPIMDFKNAAIPAEKITSVDANKAKMRALAKACSFHGLGLYVYEGEDIPEAKKKELSDSAEALIKARNGVQKIARKVADSGVSNDVICKVIADNNDGNKFPKSIPTIELCETISKLISELEVKKSKKEN